MMNYHDVNGQLTKAGRKLSDRARKILAPLIFPAKDGWEAKEREMIVIAALSAVRVLRALRIMKPLNLFRDTRCYWCGKPVPVKGGKKVRRMWVHSGTCYRMSH